MFGKQRHHGKVDDERCWAHGFARAEAHCQTCGHGYCGRCLVYSEGRHRPPYCTACALVAAGIRSHR